MLKLNLKVLDKGREEMNEKGKGKSSPLKNENAFSTKSCL